MAKIIDRISFNNLSRIGKGSKVDNLTVPGISSEDDLQDYIDAGEEYRNIQSVLIDWNDATGVFGFTDENPLKTTGQLLHELNTTCASKPNLIKVNGNLYETKIDEPSSDDLSYIEEPYIEEPYIELPDYPNWYSLGGKPKTFPPTIGTTSTTAAAGDHAHPLTISQSWGNDAFPFEFGSTYILNAAGTPFKFTMPKAPTIPTKVSQLTNDKGYLTAHPAKGSASVTIGGDNTFIREIQFDDNGHFVSAYLMTIDELKELLGIGSGEEPVIETKKYVYVGQVDPRSEGFSFDDITAVEGSVINEEVTSKVEIPISLKGPRDYWYIAAPKSLNYTIYDSTGQINVESQADIEYATIDEIEYKIYITPVKTSAFDQVLK